MNAPAQIAISLCLEKRIPFAAWRCPGANDLHFYSDPYGEKSEGQQCFVMGKFGDKLENCNKIPCRLDAAETIRAVSDMPARSLKKIAINATDKAQYLRKVESLISSLRHRGEAKTVISKVWTAPIEDFEAIAAFNRLLQESTDLFCHLSYHPDRGCWIGATPELLLMARNNQFKTVALAGTKHRDADWDEKNIQEQHLVEKYVESQLQEIGIKYNKTAPLTLDYGNLCHLATYFHGDLDSSGFQRIVDAINPTPALCGYPRQQAMADIEAIETEPRGYYGGVVGYMDDRQCQLYVNIRCIHFDDATMVCRTGGGIMPTSVAESEWEETEDKRKVTLKMLTGK